MGYSYEIEYISTNTFGPADGLSKLPAGPDVHFDENDFAMNFVVSQIQELTVSIGCICGVYVQYIASNCSPCITISREPSKVPYKPWKTSERPWKRIHIDFAGPFLNRMFLVIIDAHSKWPGSNTTPWYNCNYNN